jgi:hypothetical protein
MSGFYQDGIEKAYRTMFECGMSGTHVSLGEDGRVLKLKELYDDFKDIPAEYTIYKEEDICKTKDGI